MGFEDAEEQTVLSDIRSKPSAEFIAGVRKSFPVEPEIDRILTRKMERRSGPGYQGASIDVLKDGITSLVRSRTGKDCTIRNARWLQGGASKIQLAFDLDWTEPDGTGRTAEPVVLRMESSEGIVETSRRREFEILQAMQEVLPVPACYWMDAEGDFLPYPALVYGFSQGVAKPQSSKSKVTGVGTAFGPELRSALGPQFAENLAVIHTAPAEALVGLTAFQQPEVGSNASTIRQVNWWRRVWEEDRPEDNPIINIAYRWLIENAPPLDHVSVVHGDFRAGNFLFDEDDCKVTAWLDWELAVLGDRHQDIAWATAPYFGNVAEDGHTFLVSGLIEPEKFHEIYEARSMLSISPDRLQYFRIFNDFMATVHMLGSAWRVSNGGKTHQDVTVSWLSMIGHGILAQLSARLEEVL